VGKGLVFFLCAAGAQLKIEVRQRCALRKRGSGNPHWIGADYLAHWEEEKTNARGVFG